MAHPGGRFEQRWMTTGGQQQGALSSLGHLCGALMVPSLNRGPVLCGEGAELWTLTLWPSLCFAFCCADRIKSISPRVFFDLFIYLFVCSKRTFDSVLSAITRGASEAEEGFKHDASWCENFSDELSFIATRVAA